MKASICILNVLSDCIVLIVKRALCGVGTGPPHLAQRTAASGTARQSVIGIIHSGGVFYP